MDWKNIFGRSWRSRFAADLALIKQHLHHTMKDVEQLKEFAEKQLANNRRVEAALDSMGESIEGVKSDIELIRNEGLSPEALKLLDQIGAGIETAAEKIEATSAALKAVDEANPVKPSEQ